jgi:hypothetical protein
MVEFTQSTVDGKWRRWEKVPVDDYSSDWIVTGVFDFIAEIDEDA